ncbi:MAG: isoleucine--tRNA ligase [Candidatus Dojkabacteria bacterium]|nr:MAG: isoleucine--tRNA ligase [Candidatus Dojkabacteria bacterium]
MSKIVEAPQRAEFPKLEDKILEFWRENDTFKKSVDQRPEDKKYSFVDGPPFVSGMPHPAHLFVSIAKDVIPRYWAMKGYRVRRVFGWDCHGLPIEAKVNKKYNLTGRKQIEEEFGVERYVKECRKFVEEFSENWKWYIEKIGRWADMDNAYYTMHPEFNESVIWAFKQAWDKGYIYKGKRVSMYSTDTATPVSSFEVAMDTDNYQDTEDLSVFVKFELEENPWAKDTDKKPVYMVAWTTTPWTIPSNFALAVNPEFKYVLAEFNEQYFVVAEDRVQYTFNVNEDEVGEDAGKTVRVVKTFMGDEMDGLQYKPVYDFFVDKATKNDFHVYAFSEVTGEEGSGVLHIAPAFGEVDFNFGHEKKLSFEADIDEEGKMTVGDWKGVYLRDASPLVAEDMQLKGNLLRSEMYTHRLPYYRGDNPLIYMAQDSYFIDVQKLKKRMLELNENVNWVPGHFKHGRFADTVETSPDWAVSRNRYWATVLPLWKSEDGEELVMGSIAEMAELTDQLEAREEKGKTVYYLDGEKFSLHRDFCDKLVLKKDGKEYRRVPEVLDCWLDSGSVPFAEYHYPFENQEEFKNSSPADFIVEYSGQVRAWFNVLFRMSTMLFDQEAFKNVICHGVMAGSDGRKMSKTYGNYTDPEDVLKNIGGEAMRLYAMGSPLMAGGDMNWSDEDLNEYVKTVMIPLWNTYRYLTMYATQHNWTPKDAEYPENTVLDRWLKSYMNSVTMQYADALESYDIPGSVRLIQPTVDDISTWWIRRSRERFANGDIEALQALYAALVQFARTFAPQMPFLTEEIYQNLVVGAGLKGAKESVHLEDYLEVTEKDVDQKLLDGMAQVRTLASLGQNLREENRMKLRQPLSRAVVPVESEELRDLLREELNVKSVEYKKSRPKDDELVFNDSKGHFVGLDVTLTEELKAEGWMNDVARTVQVLRKENGFKVEDKVVVSYSTDSDEVKKMMEDFDGALREKVGAKAVVKEEKVEGEKVKLEGAELTVSVS